MWLYGFMTGVRSSRKLEAACRDQIPYLWLTGWQHPDHNTLWQFYQAHRGAMRTLMKCTVGTAVEMGLVDLAVQAVDGTKILGDASTDRTYNAVTLQKLLDRTEAAIAELEAQNEGGDDPRPRKRCVEGSSGQGVMWCGVHEHAGELEVNTLRSSLAKQPATGNPIVLSLRTGNGRVIG